MKIWEAIIYAVFGGAAELLPISFGGHSAILSGVFNLSSLSEGGGYYVRAAICPVAIIYWENFSREILEFAVTKSVICS